MRESPMNGTAQRDFTTPPFRKFQYLVPSLPACPYESVLKILPRRMDMNYIQALKLAIARLAPNINSPRIF